VRDPAMEHQEAPGKERRAGPHVQDLLRGRPLLGVHRQELAYAVLGGGRDGRPGRSLEVDVALRARPPSSNTLLASGRARCGARPYGAQCAVSSSARPAGAARQEGCHWAHSARLGPRVDPVGPYACVRQSSRVPTLGPARGRALRTMRKMSSSVSPQNGGSPLSRIYSITPRLQMSASTLYARRSTCAPPPAAGPPHARPPAAHAAVG